MCIRDRETFKLFIRFDLVFIRHLTTRQGSSVKDRPLIIFVDYLNNVSINMLVNFFIFIFKENFEWNVKKMISVRLHTCCFSYYQHCRIFIGVDVISIGNWFMVVYFHSPIILFCRSWSYDETYDAWYSLCGFALVLIL